MKQGLFFCLLFTMSTICGIEDSSKETSNKQQLISQFRKDFDKNQNNAMRWCVFGVFNALGASRLATILQAMAPSPYRNNLKKGYYFLILSTLFSMGAMLKYASNNKKLIEDTDI